jgi:hypothetical protein
MMQKVRSQLGRLRIIVDILNRLTGRSARHNRALRDIRDWAATVRKFLNDYGLYGSADTETLLKNISQANFDLINMSHKGNLLAAAADHISGTRVSPRLIRVLGEIENTRRALMNPMLRHNTLPAVVAELSKSFESLQERLSIIDYL